MELIKKLKLKKSSIVIAVFILVGVLLLMFPDETSSSAENTASYSMAEVTTYTERLEDRIRKLCSSVRGVGDVSVLVTLDCGSEFVYADNRNEQMNESGSSYSSDYLIIDDKDGSSPVTVTEIYPKIRGIALVCDGGDDPKIRQKLTDLLSAALGISSGRISITS
ncbi:MAG: hypothetical protein IJ457_03670 [Clostridia bacterium]|nr:hypothetical protein [Clostridia bacterium]